MVKFLRGFAFHTSCAVLAVSGAFVGGCVSDTKLTADVCSHQIEETVAANAAIANAGTIKDATARQAVVDAANTVLALVAACPPVAGASAAVVPVPKINVAAD